MKMHLTVFCGVVGAVFGAARLLAADANPTNTAITTIPIFVPDMSHANDPLPDGVLAWSSLRQETNVAADLPEVHFVFNFTNVSSGNVVITGAHGQCSCTATELPSNPWIIPAGTNGQIGATINLAGQSGTRIKAVTVSTDKGTKDLYMQFTVLPPVVITLTDAERARGVEIAKADRQSVFKADCATCHAHPAEGKYGKGLYDAVCAICHEGEHRASMVPDLHSLKIPTNDEFWRTWTAHGKAGSLMPAFATAEGGPLNDMQIATLASYLNSIIPSHVPPPQ